MNSEDTKSFSDDSIGGSGRLQFEESTSSSVDPMQFDSLRLNEDHFSVHSDLDYLEDYDSISNINREDVLELTISRYTDYLRNLSDNDTSNEKKRKLVKKICDLKVKLAKLREDEEIETALKSNSNSSINRDEDKNEIPLFYLKRVYNYKKYVCGHKLVLLKDIYENEKRLQTFLMKSHNLTKTKESSSPRLSMSPTSSSGILQRMHSSSNQPYSQSLINLFHLLNTTSNYIFFLTNSCVSSMDSSFVSGSSQMKGLKATNPFTNLICDYCLKTAWGKTFDLNSLISDALGKLSQSLRKSSLGNVQGPTIMGENPFLVCIYCFYSIHLNCLNKNIRKCPKMYFDNVETPFSLYEPKCSQNDCINIHDWPYLGNMLNKFNNMLNSNYDSESTSSNANSIVPATTNENSTEKDQVSSKLNPQVLNKKPDWNRVRMNRVVLRINPQIGLSKQEFRCAECRVVLTPEEKTVPKSTSSSSSDNGLLSRPVYKPRLCDYFGLYFCENCHHGDLALIPARIIHNWDFAPRPVSRAAMQTVSYLRNTAFHFDRPVLFNLVELNPMIFGLVDELIQIKRLRSELCHIYKYMSQCKQPGKPRHFVSIICQLGPHLLQEEQIDHLSFTDLCDLTTLFNNLSQLEHFFIQHITVCESCKGKGFFCELCPNKDDVLFPFSPNTITCKKCAAVFHKNCYYRRNRQCPRCNRINKKLTETSSQEIDNDDRSSGS